jgi:hypothetical protein
MNTVLKLAGAAILATMLGACAAETKDPYAKAGFFTHVHDGRLWVLKAGDKDAEIVAKNQEPRVVVTRIAAGPNRMTVKSNDAAVIDSYLAAK